ncbi:MAG: iron complex transport system substrate-binding protein [Puniceicoccaceae bacterium 5H]|nr:MAG: iron complex transport system substrate-binding protein [Puniceicoccaceae bacterium 5H]
MALSKKEKVTVFVVGFVIGTAALTLVYPLIKPQENAHPWREQTAAEGSFPYTFTDDYGRELTLNRQPRHYISLAPSITEIIYAMGLGDHIMAVTDFDEYPAEAKSLRERGGTVGSLNTPNQEMMLALQPDVIIGSDLTPITIYQQLQDPPRTVTVAFSHDSYEDVIKDIKQISLVLGTPGRGLELVHELEAKHDQIAQRLESVEDEPKRKAIVLYGIEENLLPGFSPGKDTWVGDLLEQSHAENIAGASKSGWGQLGLEGLLAAQPEVILVTDGRTPEEKQQLRERLNKLAAHPVWSQMPAVRNSRVVILPAGVFSIAGPRMVEAYEALARGVWPEAFRSGS